MSAREAGRWLIKGCIMEAEREAGKFDPRRIPLILSGQIIFYAHGEANFMKAWPVRWVGWLLLVLSNWVYSPALFAAPGGYEAGVPVEGGADTTLALRDLADGVGLWIGPAVAYGPLVNEPIYGSTLRREFNFLTAENAMK